MTVLSRKCATSHQMASTAPCERGSNTVTLGVPLDPETRQPSGGVPHISMYDLPVPVKERPWRLEMARSARLLHMAKGAASHS